MVIKANNISNINAMAAMKRLSLWGLGGANPP
jgi:hypothetical protein